MNSYNLSRMWFDFSFDNPEKIKPNHCALYFFAIEHCNRLGWKKKFGLPTSMAMEAIGIKSYNTYKSTLQDLIKWGFIEMVEISKNQYSSNIIALSNFEKAIDKANNKALDKALLKHTKKHSESTQQSTVQSIDSIDKQLKKEQINHLTNKQIISPDGLSIGEKFLSDPDYRIAALVAEEEKKKVAPKKKSTQLEILDRCQMPFTSDNFTKTWLLYLQYKQQKKKPYTSEIGMQAALNKCSKYPEQEVINSLIKAMSNNWDGFFPEKEKTNGTSTQHGNQQSSVQDQYQRLRAKIDEGNRIWEQINSG